MAVLVASRSVPGAGSVVDFLKAEGFAAHPWEVGTELPKPMEGQWEAVILDLREPWPVKARFLPAGPRIAVIEPGNEPLLRIARERGVRRLMYGPKAFELAGAVRQVLEEGKRADRNLPDFFLQADLPMAVAHPLYGIESGNPAFCRWLETKREELQELDLVSLFGPEEARFLSGLFLDLLAGERETAWRETSFRLPDGREQTMDVSFSAVFRDDLERARILLTLGDARSIRCAEKRLEEASRNLAILRTINLTLNETLDPRATLKTLAGLLRSHAEVDAAAVFLMDGVTLKLNFAEGEGFRKETILSRTPAPGQGLAGACALRREPVLVLDLDFPGDLSPEPFLRTEEGFRSACAAPLLAANRLLGVVEIFRKEKPEKPAAWAEMLSSVAAQASAALHRGFLVEELERAILELNLAYDSTIEGWSRAMDLKCREPEGHTERITEMTIRLARRTGVKEKDLQAIRRGAVLHDIGKMGIPDAILTKPGPLTEEEWKTMRLHPVYALQMLQPIAFLRDSVAIPYSHHEHWDGQGYPLGLKGEQIPLSARIFSVVDVWSSLTTDQPYRKAWKADRAGTYIRENAGRLFDPEIVKAFLGMIGDSGDS
jgi:HD-GYP domain-containing protein (c-di-GMP phosphodiesterase class II)